MKKLYFLNEEEKQRILNIHESATKNQYLSEQSVIGAPNYGTIDNRPSAPTKNVGLERDKNWDTLYSCVKNQPGAKSGKMKDGSTSYNIGGVWYYNTGRKMVNGKMVSYSCDTEFKGGKTKSGGLQQERQQIISKTNENTKAIQKLLGLPETGVMDSTLLQKINEKLNGNSQPQVNRPTVDSLQQTLKSAGVVNTQQPQLTTATNQLQQIQSSLQQQLMAANKKK